MEWYWILTIVLASLTAWLIISTLFYKPFFKRLYDIILSLLALIVLSPVFLVVGIMVKVKLGSPILFRSVRVGKNNKEFGLIKFRSMTDKKDEKGNLLPDVERLTKFGRILRSTSLDELPELINILKGDMSIVGPRPLPPEYLPYYTDVEIGRHSVRPGLSGLAQVNGRNSISWDKKFQYDVEYVNKCSFFLDVKIVLLTFKKVFIREGIGQGEERPGNLNEMREPFKK